MHMLQQAGMLSSSACSWACMLPLCSPAAFAAVTALRVAQQAAAALAGTLPTAEQAAIAAAAAAATAAAGISQAASVLPQSSALRRAKNSSCEYLMIATMAAMPPETEGAPLLQRGSTAKFSENAALYPAWLVTYSTPEVVNYY